MNAADFKVAAVLQAGPGDGLEVGVTQGHEVLLVRWQREVHRYDWQPKTDPNGHWVFRWRGKVGEMGKPAATVLVVLSRRPMEGEGGAA